MTLFASLVRCPPENTTTGDHRPYGNAYNCRLQAQGRYPRIRFKTAVRVGRILCLEGGQTQCWE